MLTQIYAIPGWGFQANIFHTLNNEKFNIFGLDYMHLSKLSLTEIAHQISHKLPDQTILLGWSFGGLIAIQLAALFPNKVNKLILLASQPKWRADFNWIGINPDNVRAFEAALLHNFNKQMEYFFRLVCYPNRMMDLRKTLKQHLFPNQAQQLISLLSILFDADLRTEYRGLHINIFHIMSQKDAVLSQNALQLKALNSRVNTMTIENIGHAGFLTTRSTYIDAIEGFLNDD